MSSEKLNLYEVLNVDKDATQAIIRKAYYSLAQIWHPDKHTDKSNTHAHSKFKQIAHAYEVLSEPNKRKHYDYELEHGTNSDDKDSNSDNDDYENVITQVNVSLEDIYNGTTIQHTIQRYTKCNKCVDRETVKCDMCNGKGARCAIVGGKIPMMIPCNICNGDGIDPSAPRCSKCHGIKFHHETVELTIDIRHGLQFDLPIIIPDEGNATNNNSRTSVVVMVSGLPHETFKRDGNDLIMNIDLSFAESIIGFVRTFKHLDNKTYTINHTTPIRHNDIFMVKHLGMTVEGNLLVSFNVEHPCNIDLTQGNKQKIWQILTKKSYDIDTDIVYDNCVNMVNYEKYKQKHKQNQINNKQCNMQ